MIEKSTRESVKEEIREQINVLQGLVDRLPGSKEETLAQLDAMQKKVRVMQEERIPSKGEDDTYIGS